MSVMNTFTPGHGKIIIKYWVLIKCACHIFMGHQKKFDREKSHKITNIRLTFYLCQVTGIRFEERINARLMVVCKINLMKYSRSYLNLNLVKNTAKAGGQSDFRDPSGHVILDVPVSLFFLII